MATMPKLRPSVTVRDMQLISECLDFRINSLVKGQQAGNPVLLELVKLRHYCEGFIPKQSAAELMLARLLAEQGMSNSELIPTSEDSPLPSEQYSGIISNSEQSVLDNPNLTDDQRYDLLALRGPKNRTEAEAKWFLETGTLILFKRNGIKTSTVNEGDL